MDLDGLRAHDGAALKARDVARTDADVWAFTINTLENERAAERLHDLGVRMVTHSVLVVSEQGRVRLSDVRTGAPSDQATDALVPVTA